MIMPHKVKIGEVFKLYIAQLCVWPKQTTSTVDMEVRGGNLYKQFLYETMHT